MVTLTRDPIDAAALAAAASHPDAGAVVLFLGTVRARTGEERTAALVYEAYEEMALSVMRQIEAEVQSRWPALGVCLTHRLGRLGVGEVSVGVAVSTPHRPEAFAAGQYAIDRLKAEVPIWKLDVPPDGGGPTWQHPTA